MMASGTSTTEFPRQAHESANLRVTTFNILAPIYNRHQGCDNPCESECELTYSARNEKIVDEILNINGEVICLQVRVCLHGVVSIVTTSPCHRNQAKVELRKKLGIFAS
jgi:hypothetical protein